MLDFIEKMPKMTKSKKMKNNVKNEKMTHLTAWDPAYSLRPCLQAPFRGAVLTPDQRAWNKSMKEVYVSVEWILVTL